jgi:hypothetical protein
LNERTSGSHDCPLNSGWRLKVKMTKCRLHVTPASRPMKTKEVRVSVLSCIGAQACTATMSATIAGIMMIIRTSRIVNLGSPIGCCGDSRDSSHTVSVTAYATSSMTVAAAEKIPSLRAVAVRGPGRACGELKPTLRPVTVRWGVLEE